ncbi:glucose-1-phosphate thymidylyltransferase [Erpetoichthys calabaricus]|uniref:Zgc:136439 n=1 Tax=Erpetoichthys calabaricus TaxID=27687 RepID=A0A8C4TR28_ERPCA|nr:glucose-1-phosphate thymidylyltransferase [Erpetoichthys calabaricus]
MRVVVLAAGYGTRLHRELEAERRAELRALLGTPKALLPVGAQPLLSRWMGLLGGRVADVCVVTNELHRRRFDDWARSFPGVRVVSDGTTTDQGRLGAVGSLHFAISHFGIADHVLVIGGDTLLTQDFRLPDFLQTFRDLQATRASASLVLSYQCAEEETSKYGILEVDEDGRVTSMKEKPCASATTSRRACPCLYLLSREAISLVPTFLEEKKSAPLETKDAPGLFLSWLIVRCPVYVYEVSGRFDVGNVTSYLECHSYFQNKEL